MLFSGSRTQTWTCVFAMIRPPGYSSPPSVKIPRTVANGWALRQSVNSRREHSVRPATATPVSNLRDLVTFVCLHDIDIRTLDSAVRVQVFAEVAAGHRLIHLAFHQRLIRLAHDAACVGVSREETERHVAMRLAVAVDVLCVQSNNLCAGDTRK